jgi:hypothetical protein
MLGFREGYTGHSAVPSSYFTSMRFLACLAFSALFLLCIDPFRTQCDDIEEAQRYEAGARTPAPDAIDTLCIMTWNIRYGGGRLPFFYESSGYRYSMTEQEVAAHLDAIAKKIRELEPDILLLQEVDVCSKRSCYVDQMQFLLDHTQLNYGAYASIWKGDCIPSDGLGRINMGNAILSKWPFDRATRISLPDRTDQSALQGLLHPGAMRFPQKPNGQAFCCLTLWFRACAIKDSGKQAHPCFWQRPIHSIPSPRCSACSAVKVRAALFRLII